MPLCKEGSNDTFFRDWMRVCVCVYVALRTKRTRERECLSWWPPSKEFFLGRERAERAGRVVVVVVVEDEESKAKQSKATRPR